MVAVKSVREGWGVLSQGYSSFGFSPPSCSFEIDRRPSENSKNLANLVTLFTFQATFMSCVDTPSL